ncbi:MAG: flagellar basal-body rod protein FlgF [Chitinispirillales bacterium]|jgi:flagellar basal-body rod protein FlgG|nr:flagellar basal-body rod protein FlgF [Chitinispirillales bacterium]
MLGSIKHASQGMILQMQKQDQIANNLANVNTIGFKSSSLFAEQVERYMNNPNHEVLPERTLKADQVFIDYREGTPIQTGNTFDLMIKGSGFFTVMTNEGIRYTRDGSFQTDSDGFLIDGNGGRVFGEDGFIRIEQTRGNVSILDDGKVMQDGQEIDTLRISDFNKPYRLTRMGNNYFRPLQPDNPVVRSDGFVIKQGYLESSNVDNIKMMVDMIAAHRNYDMISKAIQSEDSTLEKTVNQVGRL